MENYDSQYFRAARQLASSFGSYTPAFTSTIRTLFGENGTTDSEGHYQLSSSSSFSLGRLLKCASILSPFYYATLTFHREVIDSKETVEAADLLKVYTPRELATLLSVIYLTRRIGGRTDRDQWEALTNQYQRTADIGLHLGYSIPALGPERGLITAACRYLSFGIYAINNVKALKKYRVSLRVRKIPYDLDDELQNWGTTHFHLGSILLTNLGFSSEYANAYYQSALDVDPSYLTEEALKFKITTLWLDSLIINGEPPETDLGDDYFISEDRLDKFVDIISTILAEGSTQKWLFKRKADIGPKQTPNLKFELLESKSGRLSGLRGDQVESNGSSDDDLSDELEMNLSNSEGAHP